MGVVSAQIISKMDLVRQLIEDPDERLATLKEIRLQLIQQSSSAHVLAGNLKKLILALKQCLAPQQSNMFRTQIEAIHEECLKVVEQLIYKNDPDLEIHFSLILPPLIQLLESGSSTVKDLVMVCLKLYCQMTANVEQVLSLALKHGVENENPHIRHEVIKAIPEFLQYGLHRQIDRSTEFRKCLEILLIRARGDNTDSIRVQAQASLREITQLFAQETLLEVMGRLPSSQKQQLMDLAQIQTEVTLKQEAILAQMGAHRFEPATQVVANTAVAFGAVPLQLVQHIQEGSDWMMKLKSVEDLEHFLNEMSNQQRHALMNFASSFISFVEEFLIVEDDNMRIILAGVRILKFIMRNAQLAEKTNITRLIHGMVIKLNDPKEIVRIEIESFFTALAQHMKTRSLVLTLLQQFRTYRASNECKQSLLRAITTILLLQNGSPMNDLQRNLIGQEKEDNLYMLLVEPVSYLFTNPEEPTLTRYYAQECLTTMANTLSRTNILEALYECLSDERQLYDQFCDRLDAELAPFLVNVNGIQKVEYPLPQNHVFSVKVGGNHFPPQQSQVQLHPRRQISDQKKQAPSPTVVGGGPPQGPPQAARYNLPSSRGSEQQSFSHEFREYLREDNQSDQVSQGYYGGNLQRVNERHSTGGTKEESVYNYVKEERSPPPIKMSDSSAKQGRSLRKPLGDAGKAIMGANFNVEPLVHQQALPVQQVPLDIAERLRILKAKRKESGRRPSEAEYSKGVYQKIAYGYGMNPPAPESDTLSRQPSDFGSALRQSGVNLIHGSPPKNNNFGTGKYVYEQERVNSPPFFSQHTPENLYETPQIYTTKFAYMGSAQDPNAIPPHATNFTRRMMGGGLASNTVANKPSFYQKFQGTTSGKAAEIQTSKQVLSTLQEETSGVKASFDGRLSQRSDFSRGPALTNSINTNWGNNKKLQNLGNSPVGGLKRQGSSLMQDNVLKNAELEPLDNPSKSLNLALLDLKGSDANQWEKQNEAVNTIRQALKFNPEKFNSQTIAQVCPSLTKLADNLRSQLSKNAIQALQECFQVLKRQMDPFIEQCTSVFLKKSADTNVFISESARFAIEEMCLNCNEGKLLSTLFPQADHKNAVIRCQIARCLEQILRQLGPKIKTNPTEQTDKILITLASYVNDSSPEVRFHARNALLSMEYGQNPVGKREEIEQLVKRVLKKPFDQNKVIQIFQEGMERQKTLEASLQSFMSLAKSSIRQNSQTQFPGAGDGSPLKMPIKKPPSVTVERQNSQISAPLNESQNIVEKKLFGASVKNSQVFANKMSLGSKRSVNQSYSKLQSEPDVFSSSQQSQMSQEVQEQIQKELTNTLSVLLKQTSDQKKFALLNFAEAALKQKELLLQSPLFQQALNQVVVQQLMQTPTQNQLVSSKAASQSLVEAEILNNLLEQVHENISSDHISQILRSVAPYLASTNNMAKNNAENLIQKITAVYKARDICQALAESAANQGQKGKAFLVDSLAQLIPQIGEGASSPRVQKKPGGSPTKSPQKNMATLKIFTDAIFPAVYRLLEEYMAGRGKNISQELKTSIDKLIKAVFDQHGSALMEKAPTKSLPKILEIVQREKRLAEAQKLAASARAAVQAPQEDLPLDGIVSPDIQNMEDKKMEDARQEEQLNQMMEEAGRLQSNIIPTGRQLRRSDFDPPDGSQGVPEEFASPSNKVQPPGEAVVRQSIQKSEGVRLSQNQLEEVRKSQQKSVNGSDKQKPQQPRPPMKYEGPEPPPQAKNI